MKLRTLLTLIASAAAASCGGGSDQDPDQGPLQGRQRIASAVEAQAPSAEGRKTALATTASDATLATQLFDFAETRYPELFPSHRPDMAAEKWRYRYYPETGIFLVVADGLVYVLGGPFGDKVRYVGLAQDILNPPANVVVKVAAPASGKLGWNISAPAQFTLTDTAGMAVAGPYTCTSDAPAALEVAADCSAMTGRRLGSHTISVTAGAIVGKATVKVIPQAQPIGSGANAQYNLVVTPDGRALAWGSADAPLGQGPLTVAAVGLFLPTPVRAPTGDGVLTGIVAAAAGEKQAFALTEDGELYSWGAAVALGRPSQGGDLRAGKVLDPTGRQPLKGIVAVSTGTTNALALADDGTVYAWGDNTGTAGADPKVLPAAVAGGKAIAIASGALWHAALLEEGYVATWGRNTDGSLGRGIAANSNQAPGLVIDESNRVIERIVSISAGTYHGFALTANGTAMAWGRNTSGQLGRGDRGNVATRAVPVSAPSGTAPLTGLRMVVAGGNHSLALDGAGRAYSWGFQLNGELGDGRIAPRSEASTALPGPVVTPADGGHLSDVAALGAGYGHSMAFMADGRLLVWGSGYNGLLGQGGSSTARSSIPLAVKNEGGNGALNLGPLSSWPNPERRRQP